MVGIYCVFFLSGGMPRASVSHAVAMVDDSAFLIRSLLPLVCLHFEAHGERAVLFFGRLAAEVDRCFAPSFLRLAHELCTATTTVDMVLD